MMKLVLFGALVATVFAGSPSKCGDDVAATNITLSGESPTTVVVKQSCLMWGRITKSTKATSTTSATKLDGVGGWRTLCCVDKGTTCPAVGTDIKGSFIRTGSWKESTAASASDQAAGACTATKTHKYHCDNTVSATKADSMYISTVATYTADHQTTANPKVASGTKWLDLSTWKCITGSGPTATAGTPASYKDTNVCGTCDITDAHITAGVTEAAQRKLCTDKKDLGIADGTGCTNVKYDDKKGAGSKTACAWTELGTCGITKAHTTAAKTTAAELKVCTDGKDKGKSACNLLKYDDQPSAGSKTACVWTAAGTQEKAKDHAFVDDDVPLKQIVCPDGSSSSSSSGLGAGAIAGIVIGVVVAIAIVIVVIWWCKRDNSQQ